ncbi:MAG: hypothetical protein CVU41_06625 [Chloroflexi bacterium HGW-Chloroflexi-3]|nr:MAG: hypothetical protein CVU41_06625 [Chloroflexi bacterium HGW-Chloroflexi-3]
MESLNLVFLSLHNVIRWVVLVLGVVLVVRSILGWMKKWDYQERDRKLTPFFSGVYDLQILLGIILFFTKGWGSVLMNAGGEVMKTSVQRFFAVEHWTLMIVAAVLIHIGSAQVKKATENIKKYKRATIWFTIALLLTLASIPWPGMSAARPLFRFFGLVF